VTEKVVFLAYTNREKLEKDARDLLACRVCRNKTYTMIFQGDQAFPLLQCTACGNHAGYWGFAGDEQPDMDPPPDEGEKA
jgi:hypothetical protein